MRATIEQIKGRIRQESGRHGFVQDSAKWDLPPTIEIPGRKMGFRHTVECKCGHKYELFTQHSANSQAGAIQLQQALAEEMSEHALDQTARVIFELHETTQ